MQAPTVANVTRRYEAAKIDYEEFEKEIIQLKSTESTINTIVERKAYANLITSYETTLKERKRVLSLLQQLLINTLSSEKLLSNRCFIIS